MLQLGQKYGESKFSKLMGLQKIKFLLSFGGNNKFEYSKLTSLSKIVSLQNKLLIGLNLTTCEVRNISCGQQGH